MSEQSRIPMPENEISLKDIFDFLIASWKAITLTGLFGVIGSIAYLLVTPNQYLAVANFEVAKVANIEVEAPGILIEKLKIPMYYSSKSYSACNVMTADDPGELISKSLKVTLLKNSPIISISYKAASSIDAQICLETILNDIQSNQNLLAKPILENKKNQLLALNQKLEVAERFLKLFPNKSLNFDFSDSKFSASALLFTSTIDRENEIITLRNKINDLQILLTEPQTRTVSLIAPIYAPKQKISPKRLFILMGGLLGGLILGLLLMIGARALSFYKSGNSNS